MSQFKEVVLFSIIKWCCFQLLKNNLNQPSGAIFDYLVVLFWLDKNNHTLLIILNLGIALENSYVLTKKLYEVIIRGQPPDQK